MKFIFSIVAILISLIPAYSQGIDLSVAQQKKLLRLYRPHLHGGRYATSTHGILRQMVIGRPLKRRDQRLKKISIPIKTYKNMAVEVRYFIQKTQNSNDLRPLVVLINPLFSTFSMRQMQFIANYFIKSGAHVLEFENTWTSSFAKNKNYPFVPGDMWNEARMQLEILKSFTKNKLGGPTQISKVVLIGASYGSFLASVMKAYDAISERPLIQGPTVLLSPPHDILNSMKNLDRQHQEVLAHKSSLSCYFPQKFLTLLKRGLLAQDFNQKPLNEKCAKAFLVNFGFFGQLKRIVKMINKSKRLHLSRKKIKQITFESYAQDIAKLQPSTNFPKEETNIGYWMNLSKLNNYDRFIIVTTKDDNINERMDFKDNRYYNFTNSNTLLLPTGGHLGYAGVQLSNSTWMQELLTVIKQIIEKN